MTNAIGYYSLGLVGYEFYEDKNNPDKLICRFVGTEREHKARSYRIQFSPSGRAFVRPDRRRIYLDEIMRTRSIP